MSESQGVYTILIENLAIKCDRLTSSVSRNNFVSCHTILTLNVILASNHRHNLSDLQNWDNLCVVVEMDAKIYVNSLVFARWDVQDKLFSGQL